jgi:hypothetical protein
MPLRARLGLALALTALPATVLPAQYQTRTWLRWRTVETTHFAVHFPTELEPWGRLIAGKLEHVDTAVARLVGYSPQERIDVVVDDPFGIPNGSAWPFLDKPALVLWASPPNPREDIGNFVSWADMLATHEFAHLAHLLRPSRNGWQSFIWKAAPVDLGPISRKAPRWLIEGYATYVEGVVTGSGRPNGVWRPAILRQWAIEGTLPAYGQLDHMGGMYGGEFAYLAGSSFIEWLVERRGPSSLTDLWRRMTARTDRGFTDAFTGVYGEPPQILYGRFTSELTASARAFASAVNAGGADSGATIQHLARETGDPAISADGSRVALMVASASKPGRVVIWSTAAQPDTLARAAARKLIERDSLDVPAYRPFPPPRKPLASLRAVGNQPYLDPRFFHDGRVLVWRNSAIGNGAFVPDLYIWDPRLDKVQRLTRGANLREGDPAPDGASVAATRCAAGRCDLVIVDTRTAAVRELAIGSDTRSYYRPRFSPDGRQIVVGAHDGGFWRLATIRVSDGNIRFWTPPGEDFYDGAFVDDTIVVATWNMRADGGVAPTITRVTAAGAVIPIGRVTGAAVAPEYNPADRSVWFLAMHARGWDLRSMTLPASPVASVALKPTTPLNAIPAGDVPASKPYDGRRKWIYFPGAAFIRDGGSITLGLANTDPVGKHELLVLGEKSLAAGSMSQPWEGATAMLTSRGKIRSTLGLFAAEQAGAIPRSLRGGALALELGTRRERFSLKAIAGASGARSRVITGPSLEDNATRLLAFADGSASATRYREGKRTTGQVGATIAYGRLGELPIGHAILRAGVTSTELPFTASALLGTSRPGNASEQLVIGGYPPTLLPPGVATHFIAMPALPATFIAKNVEAYRVSIPVGAAHLYSWAGRAGHTLREARFEYVDGLEWTGSIGAISVLGTPAAKLNLGVGRWRNPVAGVGRWQGYLTTQFGDWIR